MKVLRHLGLLVCVVACTSCWRSEPRFSALYEKLEARDYNGVKAYLDAGGDPDARLTYSRTPLMMAALQCDVATVNLLIGHHAQLNVLQGGGEGAPLHFACMSGCRAVIQILLDSGAAVNLPEIDGKRPIFDLARASSDHSELLAMLVARGADPQRVMKNGQNALYYAATFARCHQANIKFLLRAGLRPDVPDAAGLTLLQYLEKYNEIGEYDRTLRVLGEATQGVTPQQ